MFFQLFIKECKQTLRSVTFYIFLVIMVLFYITQLGDFEVIVEPKPGQESYGLKSSDDKGKIMNAALVELVSETDYGVYTTYPIGFVKEVRLSEKESQEIYSILEKITGKSWDEIQKQLQAFYDQQVNSKGTVIMTGNNLPKIQPRENLSYESFLEMMERVDHLLGGGSSYSREEVVSGAKEELTYEEAHQKYEDILQKDQVTGAYARLFCDYMCLMAGMLPVFLSMARVLKDRKMGIQEVIFARSISSGKIVLSRFLSNLVMGIIPILGLGLILHLQCAGMASSWGVALDHLAFLKYIGFWILPTVMVTLSVGFLLTELTGSPLVVLIQGAWWWYGSMMATQRPSLHSNFDLDLMPRWNTLGETADFYQVLPELIKNRIFYVAVTIILLLLTILVYELRRKGVWGSHGKLLRNRKNKSEA